MGFEAGIGSYWLEFREEFVHAKITVVSLR